MALFPIPPALFATMLAAENGSPFFISVAATSDFCKDFLLDNSPNIRLIFSKLFCTFACLVLDATLFAFNCGNVIAFGKLVFETLLYQM